MHKQHKPVCTICHTAHIYVILCGYITTMARHIRTDVYVPTVQTQICSGSALFAISPIFTLYRVVTSPQWLHILRQKCMHKQCRPRLDQGLRYLPSPQGSRHMISLSKKKSHFAISPSYLELSHITSACTCSLFYFVRIIFRSVCKNK